MGHVVLRTLAGAFALAGLVLASIPAWADLDTADKIASAAGACGGFLGCALAIYFEVRRSAVSGHVIQAGGHGSVAAAGSAVGNATGANAKVTRPATPAPAQAPPGNNQHQVSASGPGSVAAAQDAIGNATGESSEVEER